MDGSARKFTPKGVYHVEMVCVYFYLFFRTVTAQVHIGKRFEHKIAIINSVQQFETYVLFLKRTVSEAVLLSTHNICLVEK